jgi:hypothetical protein
LHREPGAASVGGIKQALSTLALVGFLAITSSSFYRPPKEA